ncbi:MAG: dienelactone hydrolase family protein [Anaerolineae bacterium]
MCLDKPNEPPIDYVIDDYQHGHIDRRQFLKRATALLGLTAATALVEACAPAAQTTPAAPQSQAPAKSAAGAAPPVPSYGTVAPDASDLITQDVKFPGDGFEMSGYMARPKDGTSFPAIIVIHENRGLTDHIKDVARRYARAGYVALAPDLLSRSGGTGKFPQQQDATAAIGQLKQDDVIKDLTSTVNYLKTQDAVKGNKIGVVGFCWGGGNSLLLAVRDPDIAAAVTYYGVNPQNLDEVKNMNAAYLGLYGGTDQRITSGAPALEAKLKEYGKTYETKVYDGAGHAFNNDTGPSYKPDAAKDAYEKSVAWFNKYLRS